MRKLRTAMGVLALLGACGGDDREAPELEIDDAATASTRQDAAPAREDAASARQDATVPPMDASPGLIDAALQPLDDAGSADSRALTPGEQLASLDVLFVIDNSASMASEQQKLAREIPRMVEVLTTGDRYAGRAVPPGLTPAQRMFKPVRSLHLGVVSTNAGGLRGELPTSTYPAVQSCLGAGDDGLLQSSTAIARDGVIAGSREFEDYTTGDVVIEPDPSCALGAQPKYQEFVTGQGDSRAFTCAARLGVRGCPFEQPLESAWKALAPSAKWASGDPLYSFIEPNGGQGDRGNQGFLREGAALAVIVLTDEDDCSVTAAGTELFRTDSEADDKYGPVNLRCGVHQGDRALVQPVDRYLRGLHSLKPGHPERVVFAAITGIPESAIEQGLDHDAILALPAMQVQEDPLRPDLPTTACQRADPNRPIDRAYPASRIVQAAKLFAPQSVLESICADEYGSALDRMVDKLVPLLAP